MKRLLYLLVVVMMVAACGESYDEKRKVQQKRRAQLLREDSAALKVAVMPTLDCLPLFVAKEENLFAEHNADIRLKLFTAQMDCDTALQRGRVEAAVTDMVRAERMINQGMKLSYFTATDTYWQLYSYRMARIKKLEQLDDKMVSMTRYSATALLADAVTDSAKLAAERVFKIQVNDVNIRLKMLIGGEIDAVMLTEPQASMARQAHHQLLMDSRKLDVRLGAMVVNDEAVKDTARQRQLKVLRMGYNQACDSLTKHGMAHYSQLLTKYYHLRPEQLDSTLKSVIFKRMYSPREQDIETARKWLNK